MSFRVLMLVSALLIVSPVLAQEGESANFDQLIATAYKVRSADAVALGEILDELTQSTSQLNDYQRDSLAYLRGYQFAINGVLPQC
ncbi:hypothetical protein QTP81_12210 [Alteromonas sp. ASW11-36]|uniref:Uncharacterized protein n=1 Tax=Alteromonas arenosi TaxID=3055817 RepID=A0ABT7SYW5_9ALTE|nr:hypothetical protein [Alteromonas sp. ASW11-36]MDM7861361.1 hypothetical protein [Alteromonas sp. ASW11-36]